MTEAIGAKPNGCLCAGCVFKAPPGPVVQVQATETQVLHAVSTGQLDAKLVTFGIERATGRLRVYLGAGLC